MTNNSEATRVDPATNLKLRGEIISGLQHNLLHGGHSLSMIPKTISTIIDKKMWEKWVDPELRTVQQFETFKDFALAPMPDGLNISRQELLDLCHGHEDVQLKIGKEWPEDPLPKHGDVGNGRGYIITSTPPEERGTSESYTVRRLKRDRPDLAEKVERGEIKANAAAIQAGFRPRTAIIYPEDLMRTARSLAKHFTREEVYDAMGKV